MTNEERSKHAAKAMVAYQKSRQDSMTLEDDGSSIAGDLIADIMHYADENDLDFDRILRMAKSHYWSEMGELNEGMD